MNLLAANKCYKCSVREIDCHKKCQSYKKYRELVEEVNQIKREETEVLGYMKENVKRVKMW